MLYFECPKCKRIWQYPIDMCPFCIIEVERKKGEKSKVIGSSKVVIGSLNHKKVPYYGLLLEDEKGNRWAHKSMNDVKIGDEIQCNVNKDAISIWRIKYDQLEAIEEINKLLDFLPNKKDLKVLIIPQINVPNYSYFRDNTSPEFLSTMVEFLINNNVKKENIKIATQSFDETPIEASAQKSGLLDACLKKEITPSDLSKSNFVKQGNLEISEEVLKADLVINLPLLKGGDTCTTKNIFKVLKKENYSSLKYLKDEREIIKELSVALPNLINIAEAEFIQRPNKTIIFTGLILGGKDSLKLDRVFSEIVFHKKLPELINDIEINDIETNGRQIEEVRYNIESY
ncbi:MAG: DUF362 domain-containing protein [Candidatus Pacebacteria bacterium]|nr:DUF362 domain-containing protein [Candidatus Paceibacterota bacterium]